MKCINGCCWGPFGARCCNIISIVGFVYFIFNFLIFYQQQNYYQFPMTDPEKTRISFLICALIYLGCFVITLARIFYLNKLKKQNQQFEKVNAQSAQQLNAEKNKLGEGKMIPSSQ